MIFLAFDVCSNFNNVLDDVKIKVENIYRRRLTSEDWTTNVHFCVERRKKSAMFEHVKQL